MENLYLTGELLDVDGICGGYNLHFAWATGYLCAVRLRQIRRHKMLQYRQCKIDYRKDNKKEIQKKLAAKLHIRPEEITDLQIVKKSIERGRNRIFFAFIRLHFPAKAKMRF